ncbi:hypothetical protein TNIN_384611 [Trichonephila inaurata madagascariensis]|uniref:Uncharacterized protein n=1 Tax=Trichonephila inaurata madagascariensis TaxID=2747483 RepID=A0A8X6XFZ6_9ARAC|nr:hypothetical protein TNIN_384611 [Trichonephila inaurata madagascariensis]
MRRLRHPEKALLKFCVRSEVKANGPSLEADELDKAEIFLIKGIQSRISVDIKCLQQQQSSFAYGIEKS